jgi:hypothetical protein
MDGIVLTSLVLMLFFLWITVINLLMLMIERVGKAAGDRMKKRQTYDGCKKRY